MFPCSMVESRSSSVNKPSSLEGACPFSTAAAGGSRSAPRSTLRHSAVFIVWPFSLNNAPSFQICLWEVIL